MKHRVAHVASITALIVAVGLAPAALAAKGGGGRPNGDTTSSLSLVLMDGATQAAHYGRITFDVQTTATDLPRVGLRCYQGTNYVFGAYVGYYPSYLFNPWFTLNSNYWVDGVAASCTARLFYFDRRGREVVLQTMSFPAAP